MQISPHPIDMLPKTKAFHAQTFTRSPPLCDVAESENSPSRFSKECNEFIWGWEPEIFDCREMNGMVKASEREKLSELLRLEWSKFFS